MTAVRTFLKIFEFHYRTRFFCNELVLNVFCLNWKSLITKSKQPPSFLTKILYEIVINNDRYSKFRFRSQWTVLDGLVIKTPHEVYRKKCLIVYHPIQGYLDLVSFIVTARYSKRLLQKPNLTYLHFHLTSLRFGH